MPRTTPSKRSARVLARHLNGSNRQRRAHDSQERKAVPACASLLVASAPAYTSRNACFSRRGDSYDNALAETINVLYKAELIHRRVPWKTKEAVALATWEWVSWFNHHRLPEPIGYIPPAEAEANYYRQLAEQAASVALA